MQQNDIFNNHLKFQSLGSEYSVYTYEMLNAGIDRDTLMSINEDQLLQECGIKNKVHRIKIGRGVKVERGEFSSITDEGSYIDKTLDASADGATRRHMHSTMTRFLTNTCWRPDSRVPNKRIDTLIFSKQIRLLGPVLTPSRAVLTSISTSKWLY